MAKAGRSLEENGIEAPRSRCFYPPGLPYAGYDKHTRPGQRAVVDHRPAVAGESQSSRKIAELEVGLKHFNRESNTLYTSEERAQLYVWRQLGGGWRARPVGLRGLRRSRVSGRSCRCSARWRRDGLDEIDANAGRCCKASSYRDRYKSEAQVPWLSRACTKSMHVVPARQIGFTGVGGAFTESRRVCVVYF